MKMSSKMRILRGPGALRVKLGMSQEMFAQYLGIAASTVSMAERGHRPFPKKALQRLTEMEIALAGKDPEAAGQPTRPVQVSTAHQELIREKKQQIRRLDLDRARYRLERMTQQYNEITGSFAKLQLAKQLHGQVEGSQQQRALGRAEMYLTAALRTCNKEQQSKLEGRIAQLEILIAAHEPVVKQLPGIAEPIAPQPGLPEQSVQLTAGIGTAGFGMLLRGWSTVTVRIKERVEAAA